MAWYDRLLPGIALARESRAVGDTEQNLVPSRSSGGGVRQGSVFVTDEMARKSSAKWAAIRLRADLVSTMPLQVKRTNPDGSVALVTTPALQLDRIGGPTPLEEWLYSSQADLDETGNAIGVIEQRDPASGRPTWIRLVQSKNVVVRSRDGQISYHIGSARYDPIDIWHEKQYTLPGLPVGLSPLTYAAMSLGQNLSALEFGVDFFNNPGLPTVQVKNIDRVLKSDDAAVIKQRYEETMAERGVFVTGKDWDISIESVNANESQFLETLNASNQDIARFFGVPGDVIDVNSTGSSITYANITQRFLSLLVLHMQPPLVRRERKFSRDLLPNKVFAKFDANAVLRLDPQSDATLQTQLVGAEIITRDEARTHYELPPLTAAQLEQIQTLSAAGTAPAPAPTDQPEA